MTRSTRTHRGFRAPARRRAAAPSSMPLLEISGADWAFAPDRGLAPIPAAAPAAPALAELPAAVPAPVVAPAAPVLSLVPPLPVVAPAARIPAGAASVRVAHAEFPFRVVVVDLESGDDESVLVSAASPLAARRECSDEFAAPVAVFAVLPGGGEELVWGSAA